MVAIVILDFRTSYPKGTRLFSHFPLISWSFNVASKLIPPSISIYSQIETAAREELKVHQVEINVAKLLDLEMEELMQELAKTIKEDIFITINTACPLIKESQLKDSHQYLINHPELDALIPVDEALLPLVQKLSTSSDHYNYLKNFSFIVTRTASVQAGKLPLSKCHFFGVPSYLSLLTSNTEWSTVEKIAREHSSYIDFLTQRSKIKLFVTDVDGVLTDQCVILDEEKELAKKFNMRDGHGISMLKQKGIVVRFLTTEQTKFSSVRAKKLNIDMVAMVPGGKIITLTKWKEDLNLQWNEIAYIGDDIPDLECIKTVGYSACPADAEPEILDSAKYICKRNGGSGCVREFISYLFNVGAVEK